MNIVKSFLRLFSLAFAFLWLSASSTAAQIGNVANELYLQLTELACAGIDNRFAQELKALQNAAQVGGEAYNQELMKSYFLLKNFRLIYASTSWEHKQDMTFKIPRIVISSYEQNQYKELLKNSNELWNSVIALRPQTPNYLRYRQEIINNLKLIGTEATPYRFRTLKPHDIGTEVNILKATLKKAGYLDINCPENGVFDTELLYAVQKFQADHMIKADGIVGYGTYSLLFQTPGERAVSLARAILRLGDRTLLNSHTYVLVNIPDTEMYVYRNGLSIFNSRVIVGTPKRPTPRIASAINQVVLNPTWTVPPTIRNDYLNQLRRDPTYLEKHGVEIMDSSKNILDPRYIDFSQYSNEKAFPFRMVQAPGTDNALGLYKFNFPNEHFVYLHSTSSPRYFTKATRTLSSGCVRVQKARELAEFLLKGTAYTPKTISKTIESGKTHYVKPATNTPVFLAYWTAYISETGQVFYRPDPYGLDKGIKVPVAARNVR